MRIALSPQWSKRNGAAAFNERHDRLIWEAGRPTALATYAPFVSPLSHRPWWSPAASASRRNTRIVLPRNFSRFVSRSHVCRPPAFQGPAPASRERCCRKCFLRPRVRRRKRGNLLSGLCFPGDTILERCTPSHR